MPIKTERIDPPIPTTMFDWVAYVEGEEDMSEYGPTEVEALCALCERLLDHWLAATA